MSTFSLTEPTSARTNFFVAQAGNTPRLSTTIATASFFCINVLLDLSRYAA